MLEVNRAVDAPTMAVESEVDEVAARDRQLGVEVRALGDVADPRVAPSWRLAQHLEAAGRRGELAEKEPQQRRLAGPVGAEHCRE